MCRVCLDCYRIFLNQKQTYDRFIKVIGIQSFFQIELLSSLKVRDAGTGVYRNVEYRSNHRYNKPIFIFVLFYYLICLYSQPVELYLLCTRGPLCKLLPLLIDPFIADSYMQHWTENNRLKFLSYLVTGRFKPKIMSIDLRINLIHDLKKKI